MSSKKSNGKEMMKRATTAFANALKIPQLCSVRFEDIQAPLGFQLYEDQQVLKNAISVKSTWTQSSIASGSKVSFTRLDLCVQGKISENDMTNGGQAFQTICGSTMPSSNDPDSFISDYNTTKQLEILIRKKSKAGNKEEAQFILEVWKPNRLLKSVNLTEMDVHGDVYMDAELGSLSINHNGTKIAYVAEEKRPKSEPFFKGFGASVISKKKGMIVLELA